MGKNNVDREERTKVIANDILKNGLTVREAAKKYGLSKSTVHYDIHHRLDGNSNLYEDICDYLSSNFETKYLKGGAATKAKYKNLNNLKIDIDVTISCFYCNHLILDGMSSWCEIHKAGEVCSDYDFNKTRYERVKGE